MNLKRAPRDRRPRPELFDVLMDGYARWSDDSRDFPYARQRLAAHDE
jgi:hypothetical protein